jgi:rubrerythrin
MEKLSISEVFDKAIQYEEAAYKFYMYIANIVEDDSSKDTLNFLAEEETKHKKILQKYKSGEFSEGSLALDTVIDSKIVEAFGVPEIKRGMEHKDIFLVAAEREKASVEFYEGLAHMHPEGELKNLFLKFANEELKHKEKVEYLYCNSAFPQSAGG